MPNKKKKPTKKRVRTGKTKVLLELRQFKAKMKRWIENTRIVWPDGDQWKDGSTYYFVVDQNLVDFVHKMIMRGKTVNDPDEMEAALKQRVEEINSAISEKGGITDEEFNEAMADVIDEDSGDINGCEEGT